MGGKPSTLTDSIHDYTVKVMHLLSPASSHYEQLNDMYFKYRHQGLEILAFPSNQLFGKEPGTNEQIVNTVCDQFKAEFPIFAKVTINGKQVAPVFQFLKLSKPGW